MKSIKRNHLTIAFGALIFLSAFFLNISVFLSADSSNQTISLKGAFLQASADDESGGEGGNLHWSQAVPCPGTGNGTYNVCSVNGSGNSCSSAGGVTCTCSGGGCL